MTFKHLFLKDYVDGGMDSYALYKQADVYDHIDYIIQQVTEHSNLFLHIALKCNMCCDKIMFPSNHCRKCITQYTFMAEKAITQTCHVICLLQRLVNLNNLNCCDHSVPKDFPSTNLTVSIACFQYGHLRNITVGNHEYEKQGVYFTPLSLCQDFYSNGTILAGNETFEIDSNVETGMGQIKIICHSGDIWWVAPNRMNNYS